MSNLKYLISELYQGNISEIECQEASRTLVSFFQEMNKIYSRLKREQLFQEQNNIGTDYDNNKRSSN